MNHFRTRWRAEKVHCALCEKPATAFFETVEWHQVQRQPRRRDRRRMQPIRRRAKWQHAAFDLVPSDSSCGHDFLHLERVR